MSNNKLSAQFSQPSHGSRILLSGGALEAVKMLKLSIGASFLSPVEQMHQIRSWVNQIGLHLSAARLAVKKKFSLRPFSVTAEKIEKDANYLLIDSFFMANLITVQEKKEMRRQVAAGVRFFVL